MTAELEHKFHAAMLDIYHRAASECNYRPTRFLQMVNENGGLVTAKNLLTSTNPAQGLTTLWELGRLDLSMEALVCRAPWRELFSKAEIAEAVRRLQLLEHIVSDG